LFDVAVIGAGPAGSYCAGQLSAGGLRTIVVEEHPEVGAPVHCTGIVSHGLVSEFGVPERFIQKRLSSFKIISPQGRIIACPESVQANVLDRRGFDAWLAEAAMKAGAHYRLATRVLEVSQDAKKVTLHAEHGGEKVEIVARICVLATGSMSDLPGECGLGSPHAMMHSIQVDADTKHLDGAELYLGRQVAPGSFAYAVSINGTRAKIGIIAGNSVRKNFENLIASPHLKEKIVNFRSMFEYRRIPLGFPKNSVKGRIMAVGDAAGQLKTTTGGGIYFGLICSRILSQVIIDARTGRDFSPRGIAHYDQLWKRKIGKELWMGMLLRKFLELISDEDLSTLCILLEKRPFSDILAHRVNFDFHQQFLSALIKVPEFHRRLVNPLSKGLKKTLLRV
jgi:digeranylgeranylglycerophospholipid reductase